MLISTKCGDCNVNLFRKPNKPLSVNLLRQINRESQTEREREVDREIDKEADGPTAKKSRQVGSSNFPQEIIHGLLDFSQIRGPLHCYDYC